MTGLEVEISDMREDEEARVMKMEYFTNMLHEKENEIKELNECIDQLKLSENK